MKIMEMKITVLFENFGKKIFLQNLLNLKIKKKSLYNSFLL